MTVTASAVKELREMTGAGMMDCKRALEETGGDVDAAVTLLREKGIAQAAKRAGRATTEGKVAIRVDDNVGAIVAVGCETEPVSNNDEFVVFAEKVLDAVRESGEEGVAELEDERVALTAKLGENIVVVGAARLEAEEGDSFSEYVHMPARKVAVLVRGRGRGGEETNIGRELAMHIAFTRPLYTTRDEVPAEKVDAEREILLKQPDVESKPEEVRGKIVEGRMQKWFSESVLLDQAWIHDTGGKTTVAKALKDAGYDLIDYRWYALG